MGIIIVSQHNEPRKQENTRKALGRRRAQGASATGKKKKVCSVGGIASKDDSGFLKNKTWRQQEKKKVEGIQRTQHPLNAGGNHRVHTNLPTETRKVKCTQGFPS